MIDKELFFEREINKTLIELETLLIEKGKEYRRKNNPYHNFERGHEVTGQLREEVLQGFLLKHLISAEDMRQDLHAGILPTVAKVSEKYNDILVYFLIEKAMMLDRIAECENIKVTIKPSAVDRAIDALQNG